MPRILNADRNPFHQVHCIFVRSYLEPGFNT
jgi:hypothetical protein